MSKPKKIKESPEERAQKEQARRTAVRGERILASVTPEMARLAKRDYTGTAKGRANADVAQGLGVMPIRGADFSRGAGISAITGRTIGGRKALSEGLSEAYQRATKSQDTAKSNLMASGTQTQAITNASLSTIAGSEANRSLSKAKNKMDMRQAYIDGASSLAGAFAYKHEANKKTGGAGV